MVGTSILASKLILQLDFRLGIICILVIIWHQFFNMLGTEEGAGYLATLLHGEYLNPVYGLAIMIIKYDSMLVLVQDNFFNTITH